MSDAEPRVGSRFGRYRLQSLLGRGGMGVVFLAEDEQLGRRVAVKVIAPELAEDPEFRDRFLRESRLAASVDHPNVIPVHEAGNRDGVLYLVMRFVEGDDLKGVLLRDGRLAIARAAAVITQVAAALDAAHARGLVHRDVKPANVLVAAAVGGEHVYLTDFGLTKQVDSRSLTGSGEMVGTLDYLSPEQIQGDAVDRRADIYALGCVLYQCLTGRTPFVGTEAAVMLGHLQVAPDPVGSMRPDIPVGLDGVVAKAMAKEPGQRYGSAGELAMALRAVVDDHDARVEAARSARLPTSAAPLSGRHPGAEQGGGPRRERKLVSIVAVELTVAEDVDIEDAEAALAVGWSRVRERLDRAGATIFAAGGESLRAAFGIPAAHEDDPERAVRAALAVRDEVNQEETTMSSVGVRVGIASGEALVKLSAGIDTEATAAGDVVAAAARLQAAAPVGVVLVSETTRRMTTRSIEYDPAERLGIAEPGAGPIWVAIEARSRFGSDVQQTPQTPLVGRERQLELLWAALERARQDGEPELVTLLGVPGIGKSRLVWELLQRCDHDSELITWRQGRSLPYGDGVTFWALAEIVSAHAGLLQSDTAEVAARKVHAAVADVIADPTDAEWVEVHLRPLAGAGNDPGTGDRLAEAFAAWRRFIEALAEARPTVLVFEDLHWADDALLDFIDGLAEHVAGVPLLVICTARPELLERRTGWGGGKANATTLALSPLSEPDTARLVAALLEQAVLPADIQTALLAMSDGNPLYAEEYVRMLIDREILVRSGAHWRVSEDRSIPLPETVQSLIAARLDTLSDREKTVIQAAAVMGKVFWLSAVEAIGEVPRPDVEECLHRLVRKEFIRRERRPAIADETEYAFRHVLLRDVAYTQIARPDRALRHRRAAEWIDSLTDDRGDRVEMLAHHYVTALELTRATGGEPENLEKQAREALRDAGDRALELNAFAAANRYYTAALGLLPVDAAARSLVLFGVGKARYHLEDRLPDVLFEAVAALTAAGQRELAAEAETMIGLNLANNGNVPEGVAHLERAVALIAESPPSRQKAWALTSLASGYIISGDDIEHGIELARAAAEVALQLDLDDLRAEALLFIGTGLLYLDESSGLDLFNESIGLAEGTMSTMSLLCYRNAGECFEQVGDRARRLTLSAEARRRAQLLGARAVLRALTAEQVDEWYHSGDWHLALANIDQLLTESESGRPLLHYGTLRTLRGRIGLARNDSTNALVDARAGADWATHLGPGDQDNTPARAFLSWTLLAVGETAQARIEVAHTMTLAREAGSTRAARGLGDLAYSAVAVGLADELRSLARSFKIETTWCQAAVAISTGDFLRAAEIYREMGCLPDEAYARLQGGKKLLLERGHRPDARHELESALAFWRRVDAAAYIRECESLLGEAATA